MGELLLWYVSLIWADLVAVAGGIVALVIIFEVIRSVKDWLS